MNRNLLRLSLYSFATCATLISSAYSQAPSKPAATVPTVEPGLEEAQAWKWRVVPSDANGWGIPLSEPAGPAASTMPGMAATPGTTPAGTTAPLEARPTTYEVKKGDAIILIAKRFGMTALQLKTFNNLTTDTIKIGQVLNIPTVEEVRAMIPPPPPEPEKKPETKKEAATPDKPAPPLPTIMPGQENLVLQIFLDREQFSVGLIDGKSGVNLTTQTKLYQDTHEDYKSMLDFVQKARDTVGNPLAKYKLKPEDARFIAPPVTPGTKGAAEPPTPTYAQLVAAQTLVYRTPWEFVAERFHADENFIRTLNPRIKGTPSVGTEFVVPNVTPFEIEKAFEGELQPTAEARPGVKAAIVDLNRLEITQDDKLIAVFPLTLARRDLRGRGSWTILDAVPKPRLATLRESREAIKAPAPGTTPDLNSPAPKAILTDEQYLAAGPNNPVGIVWINLAKAKSTEPLPYGLHGTSIPNRMRTQEGIGGIRLTNWDIIRAVRLLPPGTPLQWK